MYHTHHFAHVETMLRASYWLTQLGFKPEEVEAHAHGVPRIAIRAGAGRAAEARMLFDAIESVDADGCPGFRHLARLPHSHPVQVDCNASTDSDSSRPAATVIGWHQVDSPPGRDPGLSAICEWMSH